MTPTQLLETAGTIVATGGALALIFVAVKSKLPQATIQIQDENIRALQEQNKLLKANVAEMTTILGELKARVSVLETIPLQSMTETMVTIASTLNELKVLGRENQGLIKASLGQANITINK